MSKDFSINIDQWIKKAKGRSNLVLRKVALELTTRVIMRSPVGNPTLWKATAPAGYVGGRFRANWQVAVNYRPRGVQATIDASGRATIAAAAEAVAGAECGSTIWLVNNLPYAISLEYGHSGQAPTGMVRVTVREFQMLVRKAVAEAKDEID